MRKIVTGLAGIILGASMCASAQGLGEQNAPFGTGLIPLSDEEYNALDERDPLLRGSLPLFVDLSNYFPTPGYQGQQGSCVGWAVGYALKTYHEAFEMQAAQPTPDLHFSPAFVFNAIKEGDSCQAGGRIITALDFVANVGAVTMDEFPYIEETCEAPPEAIQAMAQEFSIKSHSTLGRGNVFLIREALANDKPVVAGIFVYPSLFAWEGDGVYSYGTDEDIAEYHAVTIVGYDHQKRALKIINSWGDSWADDGYFWLSYDSAKEMIHEAYVTTDRRRDDPLSDADRMVLASNDSTEAPSNVAAASGPDTVTQSAPAGAEDAAEAPEPLTQAMLAASITGHVGRSAEGQTPSGYDYYPASVWLSLEEPQLAQIESAEYYFYHPTFFNPKRPVEDTNVFLATWKGYGCIENAEVKVKLKSGEEISANFDLCKIWDRFHPGAFRKDGTRSKTSPLNDGEEFLRNDAPEESKFLKKPG